MKQSELFTEVRDAIKDAVGAKRWSDSKLRRYAQRGIDAIWDRHPEAFMEDEIVTDRPVELTSSDTELPTSRSFNGALVNYVAAHCLMEDSEDANNMAKGNAFLQLFTSEMR